MYLQKLGETRKHCSFVQNTKPLYVLMADGAMCNGSANQITAFALVY